VSHGQQSGHVFQCTGLAEVTNGPRTAETLQISGSAMFGGDGLNLLPHHRLRSRVTLSRHAEMCEYRKNSKEDVYSTIAVPFSAPTPATAAWYCLPEDWGRRSTWQRQMAGMADRTRTLHRGVALDQFVATLGLHIAWKFPTAREEFADVIAYSVRSCRLVMYAPSWPWILEPGTGRVVRELRLTAVSAVSRDGLEFRRRGCHHSDDARAADGGWFGEQGCANVSAPLLADVKAH
jgi:hypothetical protein